MMTKILKTVSNFFAGILFTLAFFMLFASVFISGLVENLPVLESSLQNHLANKDLILDQVAKESGLTKQQIMEACNQDPAQPACKQLESPEMMTKPIIDEINKQITPYKSFLGGAKFLAVLFFILSIVFYFLGTWSVYASLFKVSVNTLVSAVFGFIAFSSVPKVIPGIVDQAINISASDFSSELPVDFKESLVNIMNDWMRIPLDNLNTLFIYLIIISLLASIGFYFLKRKEKKERQ